MYYSEEDCRKTLGEFRMRVEAVNQLYGGPLTDESFERMDQHLHLIEHGLPQSVYDRWEAHPREYSSGDARDAAPSRMRVVILKELEELKALTKSPRIAKRIEKLLSLLTTHDYAQHRPAYL
jgi:hypothetical protein